jgi:hypothetical protein
VDGGEALAVFFDTSDGARATKPYRRIEATLKENGIAFADNTPRVTVYQAPDGEPVAAASRLSSSEWRPSDRPSRPPRAR